MIKCITVYKAVIILKALRNRASCMVMHNLNVWKTKTDEKRKEREGGEMRVWRRQGRGKGEEAEDQGLGKKPGLSGPTTDHVSHYC